MASDGKIDYNLLGLNMGKIHETILKMYLAAHAVGERAESVMLWGPPGAGKTATIYAIAASIRKALKVPEVQLFVNATSCLEPTDVAGVPTPIDVNGITRYTSYLPAEWGYLTSTQYEEDQRAIRKDPKWQAPPAVLFFDDIVAAHFQTQTAFLKGVHEGHWGDLRTRKNVIVLAAGNRVEDNAGANDMPTALANRFLHLYANPTTDDWIEWAQSEGNIHPYVVAYLRHNKGDLQEFDENVAVRQEKAFASPRTWEMVSKVMQRGVISEKDDLFFNVVSGFIGYGMASQLGGFLKCTTDVVAPDVIVKNPHKAPVPSKRKIDAVNATVSSLQAHLKDHPEDWKAGVVYAARDDLLADFGVILARSCVLLIKKLPADIQTEAMVSEELVTLLEKREGLLALVNG